MKIKDMLSSIIRSKYMRNKGIRNVSSSLALHQRARQISYPPRSDKKKKKKRSQEQSLIIAYVIPQSIRALIRRQTREYSSY